MLDITTFSKGHTPGMFWRYDSKFINDLSSYLQDKRILEVFSGNGLLAGVLAKKGISIQATSIWSGHDAHHLGFYYPVENIDAVSAVKKYKPEFDTLLMCWPTVTESATQVARLCEGKDIIYIGEVTDYATGDLGGCATDSFFEETTVVFNFETYKGNRIEYAQVRHLR
jgi:hypothetical protein